MTAVVLDEWRDEPLFVTGLGTRKGFRVVGVLREIEGAAYAVVIVDGEPNPLLWRVLRSSAGSARTDEVVA